MEGYRQASLESWQTSAPGWAEWSGRLSEAAGGLTDWLIVRLDPQPGDTVLELAAGAGETGYEAAGRADIRLITTDFSEPMLEEARRRAETLGVANVEFRVLDAEEMDLPDDSVDGVLCRFGYMLLEDPGAAFRETRRVLRPGGRLAFATWGRAEANPWVVFGRILVERDRMTPPGPGTPGITALPDAAAVEPMLTAAGFTAVESETIEFLNPYPSFDGYWDYVSRAAGAVAPVLAAMPADEVADFRSELAERVAPFARDDGSLVFPAAALAVAGTA